MKPVMQVNNAISTLDEARGVAAAAVALLMGLGALRWMLGA
jgi:hypothetical protein